MTSVWYPTLTKLMLAAWSLTVISFDKWKMRGLPFHQEKKVFESQRSVSPSPTRNSVGMTLPLKCSSDPDWSAYPTSTLLYDPTLLFFPVTSKHHMQNAMSHPLTDTFRVIAKQMSPVILSRTLMTSTQLHFSWRTE